MFETVNKAIIFYLHYHPDFTGTCCSDITVGVSNPSTTKLPRLMGHYQKVNSSVTDGKQIWKNMYDSYIFKSMENQWMVGCSWIDIVNEMN